MEACSLLVNLRKGMQSSSEQPLVWEERYVTTLITAAKETSPSEAKGIKLGATTEYSSTIILLKRHPLKNKAYLFIFVFFQSIRTSFSSYQYQFVPSSNQVIHSSFNPYQFQFVLSLCQIIHPDKSSTQFVVVYFPAFLSSDIFFYRHHHPLLIVIISIIDPLSIDRCHNYH